MVLAIWGATLTPRLTMYSGTETWIWITAGLFAAAMIAMFARWRRGATLAVLAGTPALNVFLLVRFALAPANFLLLVFALAATALRLDFSTTLWLAWMYTCLYGLQALLLTSIAAETMAAIRGPGRAPPSDG